MDRRDQLLFVGAARREVVGGPAGAMELDRELGVAIGERPGDGPQVGARREEVGAVAPEARGRGHELPGAAVGPRAAPPREPRAAGPEEEQRRDRPRGRRHGARRGRQPREPHDEEDAREHEAGADAVARRGRRRAQAERHERRARPGARGVRQDDDREAGHREAVERGPRPGRREAPDPPVERERQEEDPHAAGHLEVVAVQGPGGRGHGAEPGHGHPEHAVVPR